MRSTVFSGLFDAIEHDYSVTLDGKNWNAFSMNCATVFTNMFAP